VDIAINYPWDKEPIIYFLSNTMPKRRRDDDDGAPVTIEANKPHKFTLVCETAGFFKKIIEAMKDFTPDVNFMVSERGFTIQTLNSSHTFFVELRIPPGMFKTFNMLVTSVCGIKMENFIKILDFVGPREKLVITCTSDEDLEISYEDNDIGKSGKIPFKLLNIDCETLSPPEYERNTAVVMTSNLYNKTFGSLLPFGDTVTITVEENSITFQTFGELGNPIITLKNGAEGGAKITTKSSFSIMFSLKHLLEFKNAVSLADNLVLRLAEDAPIMIDLTFGEGGSLHFFLAPKHND
jgi:proliferating cell nuclear antigen